MLARWRDPVRIYRPLIALLVAFAPAAHAATLQDARQFVVGLYERYRNPDTDYLGRDAPLAFTPSLLRRIREDEMNTPAGYAPNVDWDPICSCQDPSGLSLTSVDIHPIGAASAKAAVIISFGGDDQVRLGLDLIRRNGVWRVSNVHKAGSPSLIALLKDDGR
jgi:hypothetical protein